LLKTVQKSGKCDPVTAKRQAGKATAAEDETAPTIESCSSSKFDVDFTRRRFPRAAANVASDSCLHRCSSSACVFPFQPLNWRISAISCDFDFWILLRFSDLVDFAGSASDEKGQAIKRVTGNQKSKML